MKAKPRSNRKIKDASVQKKCFDYMSGANDSIFILLIHLISIDGMLKLTKGQGQKVKGQGQMSSFVKNLF